MKIRMARKLNVAPYETVDFEVTFDSDEYPDLTIDELREKAYIELVSFEVFKGAISREEGIAEVRRYRTFYSKRQKEVSV